MTQYPTDPTSPNPGSFTPEYGRPGVARPTSVTVLAIIGIVLASIGLLCNGIGFLMALIMGTMAGSGAFGPAGDQMKDPIVRGFSIGDAVVSLVLWIILLIACVGALSLKPYSRRLATRWAVAMIVLAVLRIVAQVIWVIPATNAYTQRQLQAQGTAVPISRSAISAMSYGSAGFSLVLSCIYPAFLLIFWNNPIVKRAFETGGLNDDPNAGAFTTPGSFGPPGVGPPP